MCGGGCSLGRSSEEARVCERRRASMQAARFLRERVEKEGEREKEWLVLRVDVCVRACSIGG